MRGGREEGREASEPREPGVRAGSEEVKEACGTREAAQGNQQQTMCYLDFAVAGFHVALLSPTFNCRLGVLTGEVLARGGR